jgi:hypothetical protein
VPTALRSSWVAAPDDRGHRPVAGRDIVNQIDQRAAIARRARDRGTHLGVRVVGDREERAVEVGRHPAAPFHADPSDPGERREPRGGAGRHDEHVVGPAGDERLDLALADRQRPDHDAPPSGELEQHRESEHQQATVKWCDRNGGDPTGSRLVPWCSSWCSV